MDASNHDFDTGTERFSELFAQTIDRETLNWSEEQIATIVASKNARDLYLAYSIAASKPAWHAIPSIDNLGSTISEYIVLQNPSILQLVRTYLLIRVLQADSKTFEPMVSKIAQTADTSELETFLKFLIFLPDTENYKHVAVDALRTNVATVFSAISLYNPYPALFFSEHEWNQMYLKVAFMQLELNAIVDVDTRANQDLARIISDYAHERWAASRTIDPLFWRPVTKCMNDTILADMEHLLNSKCIAENHAAALCCANSNNETALKLLNTHPDLLEQVQKGTINWETLSDQR